MTEQEEREYLEYSKKKYRDYWIKTKVQLGIDLKKPDVKIALDLVDFLDMELAEAMAWVQVYREEDREIKRLYDEGWTSYRVLTEKSERRHLLNQYKENHMKEFIEAGMVLGWSFEKTKEVLLLFKFLSEEEVDEGMMKFWDSTDTPENENFNIG